MPEPGLLDVQQRDQFLLKFQNQPVRLLHITGQFQRSQQLLRPMNARQQRPEIQPVPCRRIAADLLRKFGESGPDIQRNDGVGAGLVHSRKKDPRIPPQQFGINLVCRIRLSMPPPAVATALAASEHESECL